MSIKKPSKEVSAAIVGGIFALVAALIGSSDKIFSPGQATNSIPISLGQGEWEITEKVKIQGKNVDIVWKYRPNIKDNTLRLRGQKIKVDYANPTIGERKAISVCNLLLKGNQAEGECEESNAKDEVLRANVKLTFTENFTLVTGYFEKDGRRGSILTGVKSSI
jgi:hypothetical protein